MARSTTCDTPSTSTRWARARRVVAVVAVVASLTALGACGESDPDEPLSTPETSAGISPPAEPAEAESREAPRPGDSDALEMLEGLFERTLVPFLVQGRVSAGGHTWPIPNTFFAQDLTAGDSTPVLQDCSVFGLGRGTQDSPTPTVMVGHQANLDRSAGDYVSFAFDGEILTGGAYSHGSGQEWSWSVREVAVSYQPALDSLR